ncbi:MAG: HlyD family type I secretion periplasmic adaptor subunit [Burkholderiales bacterium]|nr:HlyD family type I secretion periplasmic adaptor subunit [Burkholderiales bacterium]
MKWVDRLAERLAPHGRAGESIAEATRIGEISRASNILLFAIAGAFTALLAWASVAEIDTVAQATGKVVPSARVQLMQSLEGGLITAIHVKAGDQVDAGTLLLSLSPTQAISDFQTRQQQALALEARIARLRAESEGLRPEFTATLREQGAEYVKVEQAAFDQRLAEQQSQQAVLSAQIAQRTQELEEARIAMVTAQRTLAAANEERDMLEKLVAQGLEPRIELVRIGRIITDAEGREKGAAAAISRLRDAIVETRARRDSAQQNFKATAREEMNRSLAELRAIEQGLPALEDRFDRTALKAPVRGVVNRVFVNTVGGVAKPGDPLVELVPADDPLVVEALVSPKDIGFIQLGQPSRVKLTAYDYSIYGAMPGKVVQVGADAVTNERGESFYQVRVQTEQNAIDSLGKALPIISGMQAQVDIITGSKTVLRYLLKPLIAVSENAFRER